MALMNNDPRLPAFIRFKNNTCCSVEIIWLNVNNKEETYGILPPNKFLDVNTYSTHPWIFRECLSRSRMVVAGKEVFLARPWVEEHRRLEFEHSIYMPLRTMILIEMPLFDLRQLCLLKLANILKNKEDINTLEIPRVLQNELVQMVSNKESCKSQLTN